MIRGFRHKGLERFFRRSEARGIPVGNAARIWRILDLLDAATKPDEMAVPGYRLHELKGNRAGTYSVTVSGNWRITFAFEGEDAVQVNLEDYH
jgi:proteic killer suppression protein